MTPALLAIIAFMLIQFGIGVWVSRRIRTEADYLVAGRRLGYPLGIFTIFATWFGAETVIGAAGSTFGEGLSLSSAEPFGYGICLILMGLVFAAPLWRRKLTTLADLFRQRYSIGVERLAAIILIPTSILWAAAQVRAFGQVLSATSTLEVDIAIAVAAGVTIAYTVFGGLMVDAITDLIQGILLSIGLLVILVAVVHALGGVGPAIEAVSRSEGLRFTELAGAGVMETVEAWAIPVLGSMIATELVARVIATRNDTVAVRSSVWAGVMYIAIGAIPVFVGLTAGALVVTPDHAEQVIPSVAQTLLPTVLYGVFAGGLLSAILSTVDSTLLVASSLLSHNVIVPLLRTPTERIKVLLARSGVIAFGIMSYLLALRGGDVYELVEESSALGSAGALVTVCFGLFTRWGGRWTAMATLGGGMVSYVVANASGLEAPFLLSLGMSLATYVGGASLESVLRSDRASLRRGDQPVEERSLTRRGS